MDSYFWVIFSPRWTVYSLTFVSECFGPRDSIRGINRGPNQSIEEVEPLEKSELA